MKLPIWARLVIATSLPLLIIAAVNWRLVSTVGQYAFLPPATSYTAEAAEQQPNNSLVIPAINVTTPVITSSTNPLNVGDWSIIKEDLTEGVSLSTALPQPGESGTSLIVGHSSDWTAHPYAAVFANLNFLKEGDSIYLKTSDQLRRYAVKEKRVVAADDIAYFTTLTNNREGDNELALVTCWPLLTTAKRLVVTASLLP